MTWPQVRWASEGLLPGLLSGHRPLRAACAAGLIELGRHPLLAPSRPAWAVPLLAALLPLAGALAVPLGPPMPPSLLAGVLAACEWADEGLLRAAAPRLLVAAAHVQRGAARRGFVQRALWRVTQVSPPAAAAVAAAAATTTLLDPTAASPLAALLAAPELAALFGTPHGRNYHGEVVAIAATLALSQLPGGGAAPGQGDTHSLIAAGHTDMHLPSAAPSAAEADALWLVATQVRAWRYAFPYAVSVAYPNAGGSLRVAARDRSASGARGARVQGGERPPGGGRRRRRRRRWPWRLDRGRAGRTVWPGRGGRRRHDSRGGLAASRGLPHRMPPAWRSVRAYARALPVPRAPPTRLVRDPCACAWHRRYLMPGPPPDGDAAVAGLVRALIGGVNAALPLPASDGDLLAAGGGAARRGCRIGARPRAHAAALAAGGDGAAREPSGLGALPYIEMLGMLASRLPSIAAAPALGALELLHGAPPLVAKRLESALARLRDPSTAPRPLAGRAAAGRGAAPAPHDLLGSAPAPPQPPPPPHAGAAPPLDGAVDAPLSERLWSAGRVVSGAADPFLVVVSHAADVDACALTFRVAVTSMLRAPVAPVRVSVALAGPCEVVPAALLPPGGTSECSRLFASLAPGATVAFAVTARVGALALCGAAVRLCAPHAPAAAPRSNGGEDDDNDDDDDVVWSDEPYGSAAAGGGGAGGGGGGGEGGLSKLSAQANRAMMERAQASRRPQSSASSADSQSAGSGGGGGPPSFDDGGGGGGDGGGGDDADAPVSRVGVELVCDTCVARTRHGTECMRVCISCMRAIRVCISCMRAIRVCISCMQRVTRARARAAATSCQSATCSCPCPSAPATGLS